MIFHTFPIFIGGLQRSGTSLLRGIIGSHPTIAIYPRDIPIWTHFYPQYIKHRNLKRSVSDILSHPKVKLVGGNIRVTTSFNDMAHEFLRLYARSVSKACYGLKMPGQQFQADQILQKHCIFIHMMRNPCDTFASHKSVGYVSDQEEFAAKWQQSAKIALKNRHKHGQRYVIIRYEDLVTSPAAVIRQICNSIGVIYCPEMLKMEGQPLWEGSNSAFPDIGGWKTGGLRKIATSGIGRFNNQPKFEIEEMKHFDY